VRADRTPHETVRRATRPRRTGAWLLAAAAMFAHAVGVPIHLAAHEHYEIGHSHHGPISDHVHTGPVGHGGHEDPEHPTHSALDHRDAAVTPSAADLSLVAALEPGACGANDELASRPADVGAPDGPPPKPPPRTPARARAPPRLHV